MKLIETAAERWHEDTAVRAISSARKEVFVHPPYYLGWLKPHDNQWLAHPPETGRHFSRSLARLVGYHQYRPNLGNIEGLCPSILLKGSLPDHFEARDAVRLDQADLVAEYVARHRSMFIGANAGQLR